MSCCGRNRNPVIVPPQSIGAPTPSAPRAATVAVFAYEGTRELTVFGRVTGRRYWFARPGAEVAVDLRDRASMRQVPNVREVRLA